MRLQAGEWKGWLATGWLGGKRVSQNAVCKIPSKQLLQKVLVGHFAVALLAWITQTSSVLLNHRS